MFLNHQDIPDKNIEEDVFNIENLANFEEMLEI